MQNPRATVRPNPERAQTEVLAATQGTQSGNARPVLDVETRQREPHGARGRDHMDSSPDAKKVLHRASQPCRSPWPSGRSGDLLSLGKAPAPSAGSVSLVGEGTFPRPGAVREPLLCSGPPHRGTLSRCVNEPRLKGAQPEKRERVLTRRQQRVPVGSSPKATKTTSSLLEPVSYQAYRIQRERTNNCFYTLGIYGWKPKLTNELLWGVRVGPSVERLTPDSVVILGSWDGALRWAPCSARSLLGTPSLPLAP